MRRIERIGKTLTKAIAVVLSFSIMFGQTIGSYADELTTETEPTVFEQAIEYIESAEAEIPAEEDFDITSEASTTATEADLTSYETAAGELETASDDTIDSANIANTTDDRDEAYAAKDAAVASLSVAETELNNSFAAIDDASGNYAAAVETHQVAEDEYTAVETAYNNAESDTAEARRLLESLEGEMAAQEAKKADLENIEDQYYGLMVYYYRTLLKGNVQYKEDGTLDVEGCARKILENPDVVNNFAETGDNAFFRFGRYLTKELVQYMIENDENVDPATANFTFGTTGTGKNVQGQEAVVFINGDGQDQVVTDKAKKDISGNTIQPGERETYKWNHSSGDAGRTSRVEVTYTDKDGVLHTEYYNYVLKNSRYDGEEGLDLQNGQFHLAVIKQKEDGSYEAVEVEDENNFDNYTKLTETIAAYNQAKADYDEAFARVQALEATLTTLSGSKAAARANLDIVVAALESAKEKLDAAEANRDHLQAVYDEAAAAVAGIDLSRFDVVSVNVVPTSNEEPTVTPAPTPAPAAPAVVTIVPDETPLAETPVFAGPFGEEEEEIEQVAAEVTIDEDETALAAGPATEDTEEEEIEAPEETVAEITEDIEGDEVPLAHMSFAESMKNIWWLWLLILITLITMYLIYKKNAKKEETH